MDDEESAETARIAAELKRSAEQEVFAIPCFERLLFSIDLAPDG